ncbi:unnamed protein product [Rotaria socialis]|uniref:Uncharacterized protein n=1 Tax=Rotaria socialis TaxID=392032 RepID=A0A818WVP8_9BILA|nr:unnamed protein product [Rotaria socialis]
MHKNVLVAKLVSEEMNKTKIYFLFKINFSIYISRNGGCTHMVCSKCQCDFCYSCDRRRFGIKFLGSHDSRFYPDKPLVRHTARGLVVGAASLEISVAAVGTTIGSPTYGTYRLIKHIRSKRYERLQRYRMETIARQWNTSDSLIVDGQIIGSDDIRRAAQVSLMTYREEIAGREQREVTSYPTRHPSHSNQDDDSFDH